MSGPTRIRVESPAPYDVVVGRGIGAELVRSLPAGARRVAVIHSETLAADADATRADISAAGHETYAIAVPAGEDAKTADVAAACWSELGRHRLTRSDAIVGLGGGATTDLAGFVAATYLRGVAVVHVPTTVLAMVDAAVGGKTGINTAEGKNLVGAFHEPAAVLCDLDRLATLSRDEIASGMAEVVKCGFIADPVILDRIESGPAAALDPAGDTIRELIERGIAVKAGVVERDLRERTSHGADVGREALNYGHTLGHAIERAERYAFRHGEAVAVGMVFAAELSRLAGRLSPDLVDRHREVIGSIGLPTSYDGADWPDLLAAMRVDKKARGDLLRFIVLDGLARPAIFEARSPELLSAAFAEISR